MFRWISSNPPLLSLIFSSDVLHRSVFARFIRNLWSRSHSDPGRSSTIDPLRSPDARSTSMGYRPRLRRTNQHDRDLLLNIWPIMPCNLVTRKFIRSSHLLRPCSGVHGRNDLVGCYSDHSSNSGCKRCFFGARHLLGGLRTECSGWSAYCGCATGVFPETIRKAGSRSVLHFHWVVWGNGHAKLLMSVWSKKVPAGRLEGT